MSTSNPPTPATHETLIPHLVCERCSEAIEFYKKAFGAVEIHRLAEPNGSRIMHAALTIGKSQLFLADDFPEYCSGISQSATALKGTPVTIHRYVDDCDAAIKQAEAAGATVVMPPADMFWGDRYGVITDPFGHKWSFGTPKVAMTPEQMKTKMEEAMRTAKA